ncbi:glycosyltransferase family 4 protein [Iodobacter fluviatilis]|uniref:Glycosyl transferase family 1 n=1 Tax=Iodobacter fluviatilis TaxID=537 RepID=A0A377SVX1_9NEIS|nr:glycosyltransferase family 4 protein [Iodobacter fluviatilis]TCU88034.1 glycosyl transferase family 1 [Iodobacter fluviatilis]STR45535.1 N-acetyl-alpha-D-glucosaminyl L-malate synthase BshA [Iodobacter fluviatilis]
MTNKNFNNDFPTVLFVQRRLPHYRVPFFEALKLELLIRGCNLRVLHGLPNQEELLKNDSGVLPWAESLPNYYFLGGKICWQPFHRQLKDADLVICSHENKLVFNLFFQYFYTEVKFALLGHGANLQGNANSLREKFKRLAAKKADWWFAYTSMSLPLITGFGFPEDRITIINNSIDTQELNLQINAIGDVESVKKALGLSGRRVGVFMGSFYHEKRIEFLLDSLVLIKNEIDDFEMIIAGDGVQRHLVEDFCDQYPWAKYVGLVKGKAKAEILAAADVMLNPGLIGLSILDSFVGAAPVLTTDCGLHSPEFVYLNHGVNGIVAINSLKNYAGAVIDLLRDSNKLEAMKAACVQSSREFSVESMARNFADGIMNCLHMPVYRKLH